MQIQFYQTRNELLKPFLEGYYFLSKHKAEGDIEYLTFPNNFVNLSVYRNTQVELKNNEVVISENSELPFSSVLVSNYTIPVKAIYSGEITEITFHFKPLGLNAFLSDLKPFPNGLLHHFNPYTDYQTVLSSVLNEDDVQLKINQIEGYWLSKLKGFRQILMENLISDLVKADENLSIGSLAVKYNTSRQNIHKLFNRYLGKSPADFRKIHRFRETLANRIISLKNEENLTALSYESLFYDQSHMVKEFKLLTGLSPKKFFENVKLKKGAGNWLFM
ncbi:helix-turn-helix domain-containing protein [Pedobacter nototheniae]|uniref:helix-turn-helix domain-containing protein n=1 Tax=Pedobacter nototheniae TaxID=2488994 RepID=UPI00292E176D|nr:helix-turn-helix domain-containing protein [Pedobacter nototheniae]